MSFLLDTNVISELTKQSPSDKVVDWFNHVDEESLFISVLTLGELQYGISKLPDGKKKNNLITWFESVKGIFYDHSIQVNSDIALKWGKLTSDYAGAGKTLHSVDGLIAATASVTGSILVTRNTADFKETGVMLMNPWEY